MKKKIIKIVIVIVVLLLLGGLLSVVIINNIKKVNIYKISSDNKDIKINGLLVKTNDDLFMGVALDRNLNNNYKKELYRREGEELLAITYQYDLVVSNYELYNYYIDPSYHYYIRIYKDDNLQEYEDINLKIDIGYQNNKKKKENYNGNSILEKSNNFKEKIQFKLNNGDGTYFYELSNNQFFDYLPEYDILIYNGLNSDGNKDEFTYDFNRLTLMYVCDDKEKDYYILYSSDRDDFCSKKDCPEIKTKKELFESLINELFQSENRVP